MKKQIRPLDIKIDEAIRKINEEISWFRRIFGGKK